MNVLVPELFRPIQPLLARLAMALGLVAVAVEATSLVTMTVPLAADGVDTTTVYLAARLFPFGFAISLSFFAGFCAIIGTLILRSALIPKPIGALMITAGTCYLLNTLATILSPDLAGVIFPPILLPCFVAELTLALWLVARPTRIQQRLRAVAAVS